MSGASNLVSRYYPPSTMGPPPPKHPSPRLHTSGPPPKSLVDVEQKYRKLKIKYFDLQSKHNHIESDLQRVKEQNLRLSQEKAAYLDRISELEAQLHTAPNHTPANHTSAFPTTKPIKLNFTNLTRAFEEPPLVLGEHPHTRAKSLARTRSQVDLDRPSVKRPKPNPVQASPAAAQTRSSLGKSSADITHASVEPQLYPVFPQPPASTPSSSRSHPPTVTPSNNARFTASQARGVNPDASSLQRITKPKRLRASNVSTKTYNIPKVPRDLVTGQPLLPLTVGIMTVLNLGTICYREHFHTERYIFPVGYEVTRRYFSTKDPAAEVVYNCQILDGGDGPSFQIIAADMPDQPIRAGTATGAWSGIVRAANLIRSRQHSNSVSGPDFFGLGQNTIKHLIQSLDGVKSLPNYVWQNFVEGGPLGGRHAAVVHALPDDTSDTQGAPSTAPPSPHHPPLPQPVTRSRLPIPPTSTRPVVSPRDAPVPREPSEDDMDEDDAASSS